MRVWRQGTGIVSWNEGGYRAKNGGGGGWRVVGGGGGGRKTKRGEKAN